ncbi:MAG TPA: Stp1/IreP family PP2C-type Ser/Thr phosphatase, partial [Gaiellaceae bacterium]|nr:Stp1/IreP family PP2C-type Ser/Thr phosphatase [Gaiellaceae bacterium]
MRIGRIGAVSDTGRRRLQNEDSLVCEPPLFAVADGMGGAQAGEVASRIAAAALEELGRAEGASLPELVREANARVWRHAIEDPSAAGMGTTVTVALVREAEGAVEIGHVGDSRAYRIRDGVLEQLTSDHTLVAELVRTGRLTQEEADTHPQRSVITRAVGTEPDVEVDAFTVAAEVGDLYFLCSDGLTDMLADDDVLAAVVEADGEPQRAAENLVHEANRAGGMDNVSVILFELLEDAVVEQPTAVAAPAPQAAADDVTLATGAAEDVTHHGAGEGSRAAALSAILLIA